METVRDLIIFAIIGLILYFIFGAFGVFVSACCVWSYINFIKSEKKFKAQKQAEEIQLLKEQQQWKEQQAQEKMAERREYQRRYREDLRAMKRFDQSR